MVARGRAIYEECDRSERECALRVERVEFGDLRNAQRRHAVRLFAVDAEAFAARRHERDVRTVAQNGGDALGDVVHEVLAVVENHERLLRACECRERRELVAVLR